MICTREREKGSQWKIFREDPLFGDAWFEWRGWGEFCAAGGRVLGFSSLQLRERERERWARISRDVWAHLDQSQSGRRGQLNRHSLSHTAVVVLQQQKSLLELGQLCL